MQKITVNIIVTVLLIFTNFFPCKTQELPKKYFEKIASTFYIRAEQKFQLKTFLDKQIDNSREQALHFLKPDYSSPENYESSIIKYREQLKELIGFPPPGTVKNGEKRFEFVGEDSLCKIYRVWIEVLNGVEAHGIYLTVKHG